jgi:hypothetical protein
VHTSNVRLKEALNETFWMHLWPPWPENNNNYIYIYIYIYETKLKNKKKSSTVKFFDAFGWLVMIANKFIVAHWPAITIHPCVAFIPN